MRRILLVEDEDMLRETFLLMMAAQPYLVDTAENGQAALDICKEQKYDLILLDLMMPVMDGLGFMKQFMPIKPDKTKIVIMSNISAGVELEAAMNLGADKSVLKASLSPRELLTMVRYELGA